MPNAPSRREIVAAILARKPVEDVAATFGLTPGQVRAIARAAGVSRSFTRKAAARYRRDLSILWKVLDGIPAERITREHRVSPACVRSVAGSLLIEIGQEVPNAWKWLRRFAVFNAP